MEDEQVEEPVFEPEPDQNFFINVCKRCDSILGTTRLFYSKRTPYVLWFFPVKSIPLVCDKCGCFTCDDCRENSDQKCSNDCPGSFVLYRM